MEIDTNQYTLERFPDDISYADIVSSGAVKTGPAVWDTNRPGIMLIPFTPEPTAAEQWAITRRLLTSDTEEEQLYIQAEQAITINRAWRQGEAVTIFNNADALEDSATATTANMRQAFTGIKLIDQQLARITEQNEQIIVLLLRLMNG
jgi:hypothetical protein